MAHPSTWHPGRIRGLKYEPLPDRMVSAAYALLLGGQFDKLLY